MEKRYSIGEISHITGVSKDTLRYYDRIGVFKPEYVDLIISTDIIHTANFGIWTLSHAAEGCRYRWNA